MELLAHGAPVSSESLWSAWPIEPLVLATVALAAWLYLSAFRRAGRFPAVRRVHFLLGLGVAFVALASPLATYAPERFAAHMIQHLLVTLVATPLLVLGAPVALALRVASPSTRRRITAVLENRAVRALTHPVTAWVLFAAVMWASHFSSLYEAALENPWMHAFEHALYLGTAWLFWEPVVGLDPRPGKLPWPARIGYLVAALPVQSFLGLALYSTDAVLYDHYLAGPDPAGDQRTAATIMWLGGDGVMLVALGFCLAAWMRAEAKDESRRSTG